ncbi:MAG TPA: sigma-70 family RNA polymerase sigma factor [Anaerolineae bacterium]|nr:sigma-70 family RNA polymerase sigma factor [Anaerolineae bacterium]HOQ98128.1 sigma-70 family RNA polymerase sigma factor [Anaerolineae bacterium]HPL30841.1 sigma-70 family RNA polymerase sigma factor [Anaerolineae bacterium]
MSTGEPEQALVARARRGDKDAFGALVVRHHRAVAAIAYHMTGDAATADDVAQAAFLRAWEQLATLRDDAAFKSWLCRLAVRASIDCLRRAPREQPLPDGVVDPAGSPEGAALAHERARAVRRAVLGLPEQCRAALILREFEGLSYKEIAQVLGIPMGTVMSRLSYARGLLRTALAATQYKRT